MCVLFEASERRFSDADRTSICRMHFSAFRLFGLLWHMWSPGGGCTIFLFTFLAVLPLQKLLILIDCCVMCRCRSSKRIAFRPTLRIRQRPLQMPFAQMNSPPPLRVHSAPLRRGAAAVQADQKSMSWPGKAAAQPTGLTLIKHFSTAKKLYQVEDWN